MYLSIIIPAYNEEKRLERTLEMVSAYLVTKNWESEVVVVSDGSRDKTVDVARSFAGKIKNLRVIDNNENRGKGAVVRQGMLGSRGDLRLFMDADNATPITELDGFLPYLSEGYDVVIGSLGLRESKFNKRKLFLRMVAGRAGNWFIQFLLLWGIYDTQRGFKLFTRQAVETIFPKVSIWGWGFDVEVLARARKLGFKIKELPVRWTDEAGSKIGFWAYPQVLWQVLKIRWLLWFFNDR